MKYVESEKMLISSVISDVISLIVTKQCQKIPKIDENRWTTWVISMTFSGKMWPMIILKVKKNQGLTFCLEDTLFEKPQGGQIDPPPAVLGISKTEAELKKSDAYKKKPVGYHSMKFRHFPDVS